MGNCCGQNTEADELDSKERNPRNLRKNVCCTDIIVLIIFIIFWVFLVYIAVMAIVRGDPSRVTNGFDSSGNVCNQKDNQAIENLTHSGRDTFGKKNVFFLSILHPKHSIQICVSKCPNRKLSSKQDVVDFYKETGVSLCQYETTPNVNLGFDRRGPCPSLPVYTSMSIMSRCVPNPLFLANETNKVDITNQFNEIFKMDDFIGKVLSDLSMCWREILGLCAICVVLAFLMVVAMRFLAFIIVWLIVILSVIGSIVATVLLWCCFGAWIHDDGSDPFLVPFVGTSIKQRTAYLLLAIAATICTVVLLLVLFVMRKRIGLVVALFREAGKCLADVPFLLIQPFFTILIFVVITSYFLFILSCISNMGTPIAREKNGITKVKYQKTAFEKQFWWIHLVGWVWTSEFVLACQEFVISCAVAIWYFTTNKKQLGNPILKSIKILTCCHLGSIAFGALVISIVKIARYILMYLEQKMKESNNDVGKMCLKCCVCCLWCLEKVLRFLHQNAYTVIAIEGSNFCSSAKKAFEIMASNALRVAAINSVGDFVLFLGKIAVMCLSGLIAFLWLRSVSGLFYIAVPVAVVGVFSFTIAHVFLSIYEMVVDALLICFCEDSNRNDGTDGNEYFMSASLMEFVTNSSAKLDALHKNKNPTQALSEDTSLKS